VYFKRMFQAAAVAQTNKRTTVYNIGV